jgi:hypothetical protein
MSQPDDHVSLELSGLRSANDTLRDEIFKIQSELNRQDRGYSALVKSLRAKATDKDTTAIRAAIYGEVADQVQDVLLGIQESS